MSMPKPHNVMRGFLAAFLIGNFMLALFWLLNMPVPAKNEQLVIFMLGQLAGLATSAAAFYFGTSKSSADKTDIIAQSPPPGAPAAQQACRCQTEAPRTATNADVDKGAELLFGERAP